MDTLERMAILRGLCGLLLSTDTVREVVGARMDAIAALQPKPKVPTSLLTCLFSASHRCQDASLQLSTYQNQCKGDQSAGCFLCSVRLRFDCSQAVRGMLKWRC